MEPILETRSLSKRFGAVVAADEVSVRVAEGEVVGVIGANGAGKTTFINMVTGYLKPSAGTVRFRGRDITGLAPREVTRAGVCRSFQIPQIFRELSVLENVLIALAMLGEGRLAWLRPLRSREREERANALLRRYALDAYAPARAATLPQGVRKLLDIAMATVARPALLLLDEPTSGVSVEEKFPLMDTVMSAVRETGAASLFVEHDMEIVARYASRVIAFYEGRVIADGPPREVLGDPEVRRHVVGTELHRTGRSAFHA
ncbi:ABC transporter ATP-binding protein [Pelomicrobium sp.]|jgi:branched-chain amino acid transport system ATP-binding protein|uniref:ABC transporter ATP-binding protein n=1 Tax=Pelomicrobium sp. TaxID=2815319 RepID=UPI002FDC9E5C